MTLMSDPMCDHGNRSFGCQDVCSIASLGRVVFGQCDRISYLIKGRAVEE